MGQRERGVAKGIDLQSAERLSDIESALVHRNQGARGDAGSYERIGFVASEQNPDSRHGRRLEQAEPEKWRPSVFGLNSLDIVLFLVLSPQAFYFILEQGCYCLPDPLMEGFEVCLGIFFWVRRITP